MTDKPRERARLKVDAPDAHLTPAGLWFAPFAADEQAHYRKRCTFYLAEIVGAAGVGEPDHELVWLSPQDARVRLFHESQRWAVAEASRRTKRTT